MYESLVRFAKVYFPEASVVAAAFDAPLKVTKVPLLAPAGMTVPEILQMAVEVAAKLIPVALAALIVTAWLPGLKVYPGFVGVTV
jgi:hypothetical protein